ncbi:thioredoxin-like protein [Mycena rosella]|uniref:Thioredoxin-like protein n=1 Tax=Mycena rosella TaxID=1033263 RepID=A0AAD7GAK6_MYCRO|nr:thioredoxin-like protein [Mycena rosella]
MSAPLEIQSIDQWNTVMRAATDAGQTVVVDFHAEWCGPCKAIAPRYNLLASQTPQVQFLRVDVDAQPLIAETFHVSAMPTFFAIKGTTVVGMLRGADPQGLTRLVQKHAGSNPEEQVALEVQNTSAVPAEPARL